MLILFNKPYGVVTQFSPHPVHRTLKDFVPVPRVYPAGRLDWDSEGLVVLTDDGRLQHRISAPGAKLPKRYLVQVEGEVEDAALERLRRGVELRDGPTLPARVRRIPEPPLWPRDPPIRVRQAIPTAWIELTLHEGRNRQVRRMTAAVGLPTLRLVRMAIGEWSLNGLKPGDYRVLDLALREPGHSPSRVGVKAQSADSAAQNARASSSRKSRR